MFSYDAQQPDELSFIVNDRLTILRKGDDAEREWWWAKNTNDIEGYVPRNLLGVSFFSYFARLIFSQLKFDFIKLDFELQVSVDDEKSMRNLKFTFCVYGWTLICRVFRPDNFDHGYEHQSLKKFNT